MMAQDRCTWTPLWSESHSRIYGLSDKFAGSKFGQRDALAPTRGEAQGRAEQQQVQACLDLLGACPGNLHEHRWFQYRFQ